MVVLGLTDREEPARRRRTDDSALVGQQFGIGGKSFTVIGVFKSKGTNGFQDQDNIAIMPYTAVQDTLVGNIGEPSTHHRAGRLAAP